jgi:ribonuclease BN (tRNA processing enzyme)
MNIKFLWTGWFDDLELGNSSAIIDIPKWRVLLDCWSTVYAALKRNNLIETIDYVLLTHLHGDHMGSLFQLLCKRKWLNLSWKTKKLIILYVNDSIKSQIELLLTIWYWDNGNAYCDFLSLDECSMISAIDTYWEHFEWVVSFAYYFDFWLDILYYSGDLWNFAITDSFIQNYTEKNIKIFHTVTFNEKHKKFHCYYKDLQELTQWIETYCYHCDHTQKPNNCTLQFVADYPEFMI